MLTAHLRKLRYRHSISAEEERAIRGLVVDVRTYRRDQIVVRAGDELSESLLLLDGWLARTKDLSDGQRQVAELNLSGDFVDLHAFTLKRLDHDLLAITDCRFAIVPHERIADLIRDYPRLQEIYWFLTNLDAAIHREWTLSLGRRSALSRLAHLFCELYLRLQIVGLASNDSYDFPLTQEDLAECLGMTAVHINRSLQELRARKLIRVECKSVSILDWRGLSEVADFDPAYLYLPAEQSVRVRAAERA